MADPWDDIPQPEDGLQQLPQLEQLPQLQQLPQMQQQAPQRPPIQWSQSHDLMLQRLKNGKATADNELMQGKITNDMHADYYRQIDEQAAPLEQAQQQYQKQQKQQAMQEAMEQSAMQESIRTIHRQTRASNFNKEVGEYVDKLSGDHGAYMQNDKGDWTEMTLDRAQNQRDAATPDAGGEGGGGGGGAGAAPEGGLSAIPGTAAAISPEESEQIESANAPIMGGQGMPKSAEMEKERERLAMKKANEQPIDEMMKQDAENVGVNAPVWDKATAEKQKQAALLQASEMRRQQQQQASEPPQWKVVSQTGMPKEDPSMLNQAELEELRRQAEVAHPHIYGEGPRFDSMRAHRQQSADETFRHLVDQHSRKKQHDADRKAASLEAQRHEAAGSSKQDKAFDNAKALEQTKQENREKLELQKKDRKEADDRYQSRVDFHARELESEDDKLGKADDKYKRRSFEEKRDLARQRAEDDVSHAKARSNPSHKELLGLKAKYPNFQDAPPEVKKRVKELMGGGQQ